MLGETPDNTPQTHTGPAARAFHRTCLTQAVLNLLLLENKTHQGLQPIPEMLGNDDTCRAQRSNTGLQLGTARLQLARAAEFWLLGQG